MEKPHRMAQVYGYIVCLVSVITFIICLANIIPAMIDRGDPMHASSMFGMQNSPSLASFENYKMDVMKSMNKEGEGSQSFIPDDQTLRAMYEAAKDERIQNVLHSSNRTIMVSGIILVVSILLFITHWMWMRKLARLVVSN